MSSGATHFVTHADGVRPYRQQKASPETAMLSLRYDYLRTDVDLLGSDVKASHDLVRRTELNDRTFHKAARSTSELLRELTDQRNLAWSTIAEVVGVSVSAIRKWRTGGSPTKENKLAIARFAAMLDLLQEKGLISDPGAWIEMDLPFHDDGYYLRPLDLYLANHEVPLLDIAEQRKPVAQVLDDVWPEWRQSRSRFEVYTDLDGARSIRFRES